MFTATDNVSFTVATFIALRNGRSFTSYSLQRLFSGSLRASCVRMPLWRAACPFTLRKMSLHGPTYD